MLFAGIDCGAKNTKTVVMRGGEILGKGMALTGFDLDKAIQESLELACEEAGVSQTDILRFGGTGSGKSGVKGAVAVDDIKAIGRCAFFFFPSARTVADVGAEEGRAAKLDEKGDTVDFAVNEKCAAGAGAFIEAMARAIEVPLYEMGPLAQTSGKEIAMNGQCAVFAEFEAVGLIHAKVEKKEISRAVHEAVASRVVSMIRRIGVNPEVVMLGGVANNPGFVDAVQRRLGVEKLLIPEWPEYGAAVGAALVAAQETSPL